MKLLNFSTKAESAMRLGALSEPATAIDLPAAFHALHGTAAPVWFCSVADLLSGGPDAMKLATDTLFAASRDPVLLKKAGFGIDQIQFHPPAAPAAKVICVTINYESHTTPGYSQPAKEPYFFIKFPSIMTPHRAPIVLSKTSQKCDSEIELVIVIGKRGKYIRREDAFDHVAGYTIGNDFSFRDRRTIKSEPESQRLHWLTLKNLDTAAPIGPWLVTKDEIPDPYALDVTLCLENEPTVRAVGTTGHMIHKIPDLIAEASDGLTLEPGDVIFTGTPLPVAFGTNRFLRAGDVLRAEISKIGALVNPMREEV